MRLRFRVGSPIALCVRHCRPPGCQSVCRYPYPKLRAKYGKSVRYAQDKTAHLKTEFGFDTVQVAKTRYASQQYHDFIGFQVSKSLLERVFPVVYGVELKEVLSIWLYWTGFLVLIGAQFNAELFQEYKGRSAPEAGRTAHRGLAA